MLRTLMTIVLLLPAAGLAADSDILPYVGRQVAEVIDEFRDAGQPFAYSTNLVSADLVVQAEPEATDPLGIVRDILRPHGLTIRSDSGVHLVVRVDSSTQPGDLTTTPSGSHITKPELETIVISVSRYEIFSDMAASRFSLDQRTIQNSPHKCTFYRRIYACIHSSARYRSTGKNRFDPDDNTFYSCQCQRDYNA